MPEEEECEWRSVTTKKVYAIMHQCNKIDKGERIGLVARPAKDIGSFERS